VSHTLHPETEQAVQEYPGEHCGCIKTKAREIINTCQILIVSLDY
jgi:hypothetical protein